MPFVVLLLRAMVRLDAEALVVSAGDVPYVVGAGENRHDVGTRAMPAAVVALITKQLLPPELQAAFEDVGEIKYELPEMGDVPGQQFTVVAAIEPALHVDIHRRRSDEGLMLPPSDSIWPAA
ncbi:MAG: hypothetical protein ACHQO8_13310 [Vicinamibacterales bacterium]